MKDLYRTKLSDGSYLEPSVEIIELDKMGKVLSMIFIILLIILGMVFVWFIALKQGMI